MAFETRKSTRKILLALNFALEHFRAKWKPVRVKEMRPNNNLEHFRAKWKPVRVKEMRSNNNLAPFRHLIKLATALACLFGLFPCNAYGQFVNFPNDHEFYLANVRVEQRILSDSLEIYHVSDGGVYLNFDQFVEIVEFDIRRSGDARTGHLRTPKSTFALDPVSSTVDIDGSKTTVGEYDAFWLEDAILVRIEIIAKWFDVVLVFDSFQQELTIKSQQALPFQQRLNRKKRHTVLDQKGLESQSENILDVPNQYHWMTSPQIDLTAAAAYSENQNQSADTETLGLSAGFDLLGNAVFYGGFFSRSHPGDVVTQQRLTVEKHSRFPDEDIFLGVNSYRFGDLYVTETPLLFSGRAARGVFLAKEDYLRLAKSETADIVGDGPVGWEVELYRDNVLLNFGVVDTSGRFVFEDTSLHFGQNLFVVKLYSPEGRVREQTIEYWAGGRPLDKGAISYRFDFLDFTRGLIDADLIDASGGAKWASTAQFDAAVTDNIQLGAGFTSARLESRQNSGVFQTENYLRTNTRLDFGFGAILADWVRHFDKGNAYHVSIYATMFGQQWNVAHEGYDDAFESQKTRRIEKLKTLSFIEVSSPLDLNWLDHYLLRFSYRDRLGSTNESRVRLSLNGHFSKFYWNNRLERINTSGQNTRNEGRFRLTTRRGNLLFRNQISYNIDADNPIESISELIGWEINSNWYNQTRIVSSLTGSKPTDISNELSWKNDSFSLALTGSADFENHWSLGVRLSSALGIDQDDNIYASARPHARSARARLNFFVDNNANEKFDSDEQPLSNVVINKHFATGPSNNDGELLLTNLPTGSPLTIKASDIQLDDPFLKLSKDVIRVYTHSGGVSQADIPVQIVGAIEGVISRVVNDNISPYPNQIVYLLKDNKIIAQTETQFDGYYSFEDIPVSEDYVIRAIDKRAASESVEIGFRLSEADEYRQLKEVVFQDNRIAAIDPPRQQDRPVAVLYQPGQQNRPVAMVEPPLQVIRPITVTYQASLRDGPAAIANRPHLRDVAVIGRPRLRDFEVVNRLRKKDCRPDRVAQLPLILMASLDQSSRCISDI